MNTIYGNFPEKQISDYKKILHGKIHWLLLYKEEKYEFLDNYFNTLMLQISGLNNIFNNSPEVIELLATLQSARDISNMNNCDFKQYRKLIFDAHSLVDRIKE